MADKKDEKLEKKGAVKEKVSSKNKEKQSPKNVETVPKKEDNKEEQVTQYYVLPDNAPAQAGQDLGFGIKTNAGTPDQGAAAKRKMRKKEGSIASGIVSYILLAIGIVCGVFGIYLKTVLFVDEASSIILTIFGFGIFIYGLLFIGIILQIISMILAFVQIGQNRRAFSIVTVCIVPLLNLAVMVAGVYFLFGSAV